VDYPAIRALQAASSLESGAEAASWRGETPRPALPPVRGRLVPLRPLPDRALPREPLEAVIARRGSTRRFDPRRPIGFDELSTALDRSTRGIPADFLEPPGASLIDVYLIAHHVEGLAPGAYFLRRDERALELLRDGEFRLAAGRLALFQELAATAAANVYCLCDLDPVLERFGNRGYRAAQLEGGLVGGRLYLAAYALGFGATGLTFLDDEVTEFFSPHAGERAVMFLVALGRSARRAG
jgi:nitroreductase